MAVPLNLRKRKISFFDLEKKLFVGLDYIEDVIESRIKYVRDISDHVEILRRFPVVFTNNNKMLEDVYCIAKEELNLSLVSIGSVSSIKEVKKREDQIIYRIQFSDRKSYELSLFSSSDRFSFVGSGESLGKIEGIRSNRYNRVVPIDYNKILIGPVNSSRDDLFDQLQDIGEIVSLRNTMLDNYYAFAFNDPELCKGFVDVMTEARKERNDLPEVRFCYQDNIILKFGGVSLACSFKPTKIVFILNLDIKINLQGLLKEKCRDAKISNLVEYNPLDKFKELGMSNTPSRIFVECCDLTSSEIIYHSLGGLELEEKILVTGFYSEYNFSIGEYD